MYIGQMCLESHYQFVIDVDVALMPNILNIDIVGTQKNRLNETVLLSNQNIK